MTSQIHAAILDAMREAAAVGISKSSTAMLGGGSVKYRGIEAAMNTMCGILVRCGIIVSARYTKPDIMERAKGDGKATRFAVIFGSFTFAAADGSSVVVECCGEAMDSGDKAVTKAQSVAFRTALFQTFVVPTAATAIDPETDDDEPESVAPADAVAAAAQGLAAYQAYFAGLTKNSRAALAPHHGALKAAAELADAAKAE